ncbi:ATP-binding protein [Biformimicrobium ophioploci]|uniref:histidine kinase n=1 Tax=Biformimicrobium ophioploci TaxID=3036711 RepID=A0ABQ6M2E6_9GAMM|nr:ATP-binding protein [Microbulbifer sp. NKW57]GMG88536.1 ATP-binding protein [Microbulbifer sp. NKW57]
MAPSQILHSLKGRLALVASVVLLAFLILVTGVFVRAYQASLDEAKQRELKLHIYNLLAAAEDEGDGRLQLPPAMPEARFNQPESGLIGTVVNDAGEVIWRSESALTAGGLQIEPLEQGAEKFVANQDGFAQMAMGVGWGLESEYRFTFSVFEDVSSTRAQVEQFRGTIWRWLGVGAALLLLVLWLVLRWGLAPLQEVARSLKKIQQGEAEKLEGDFPAELRPLTENLNLLVDNERRQRQRYRNTLADLAHSLKTPLAVLKGVDGSPGSLELIRDQVARMDQLVSYQLQRAVTNAPRTILRGIAIRPIAEKLVRALEKVYASRDIEISLECAPQLLFHGDEGDLMELLGNLLDNACKYGGGVVRIEVAPEQGEYGLSFVVADNGPGLTGQQWQQVLARGVRADEQQSGQGIGLAVVSDIVESYGGEIALLAGDAPQSLGGATIRIQL